MFKNRMVIFTVSFIIVVAACVIFLVNQKGNIDVNSIQSVLIIAKEESLEVEIIDSNDVKYICDLLNKRVASWSPSCPFGYVKIILKSEKNDYTFYPATDSCSIFKIENEKKHFEISEKDWNSLMELFEKYNIDRSLLETAKGV